MSGASKILTVSYGTFSCTLEGFDDPFTTMRHIAEYFRDLAAEDRYFGCEPPVPDAEMLQQIAQRSIRKRVAAEMQDGGLVLRQSTEDVAEAAPRERAAEPRAERPAAASLSLLTVGMPSASEKLDRIRRAADDSRAAPEGASITALFETDDQDESEAPEPLAETGSKTADTVAQAVTLVADVPAAPEAEAILPVFSEESSPQAAEPLAGPSARELEAETGAPTDTGVASEASGDVAATAAQAGIGPMAGTDAEPPLEAGHVTEPEAATAAEPEAEPAEARIAAEAAEQPVAAGNALSKLRRARERLSRFARRDSEPEAAEDVAEAAEARIAAVATEAADETPDVKPAVPEAAPMIAAGTRDTDEDTAAEAPEYAATGEQPEPVAEAAEVPEAEPAGSALSFEAEAELEAELAALREDDETVEDDLAAALDTSVPYMPAEAEPAPEQLPESGEVPGVSVEAAPEEAAEPAPLVHATAETEEAAGADESAPQMDEHASSPFQPVDEAQEERALARLLETADSKLSGTETTRKRNAFQQLKAAVAATFADRQARKETVEATETEARSAVYRSDLRRATRPTRPQIPERSSDKRPPAPAVTRAAPLVLVSAQRIDEHREGRPSDGGGIRPRRVLREMGDDLKEFGPISAQTPEEGDSFRDFAERIGANSLSELLEAAAAYTAHVEGRTRFSRAQVMSKIALLKADDSDGFSREDGLRSFGKLLREGRIRRVQDGQFVIAEESRFVQEARTGTL